MERFSAENTSAAVICASFTDSITDSNYSHKNTTDTGKLLRRPFDEAALAHKALNTLPLEESCRGFKVFSHNSTNAFGWIPLVFLLTVKPEIFLATLIAIYVAVIAINSAFKLVLFLASFKRFAFRRENSPKNKRRAHNDASELPVRKALPTIAVLVPLYHEANIVPALIKRLRRLRYPREKLDIIFIVEQDDPETAKCLNAAPLKSYMHVVVVPAGPISTKPRALNFVLPLLKSELVGIYDGEDAPDADQLMKVAETFASAPRNLAAVQARLAFYNSKTNWLARCFALEYATWFSRILKGLSISNLPIPLGGTSNFIKRKVLCEVGAWDAFNVTEDADLGIRLAKYGYQTRIIDSTTYEEANCRIWPWIRQRSRWLKGFILTYLVQMRTPGKIIRTCGWRGFIAINLLFPCALLGFLLFPVAVCTLASPASLSAAFELFALNEAYITLPYWTMLSCAGTFLTITIISAKDSGIFALSGWALLLPVYFGLAFIALCKAILEMLFIPFYWDKTHHGVFEATENCQGICAKNP